MTDMTSNIAKKGSIRSGGGGNLYDKVISDGERLSPPKTRDNINKGHALRQTDWLKCQQREDSNEPDRPKLI